MALWERYNYPQSANKETWGKYSWPPIGHIFYPRGKFRQWLVCWTPLHVYKDNLWNSSQKHPKFGSDRERNPLQPSRSDVSCCFCAVALSEKPSTSIRIGTRFLQSHGLVLIFRSGHPQITLFSLAEPHWRMGGKSAWTQMLPESRKLYRKNWQVMNLLINLCCFCQISLTPRKGRILKPWFSRVLIYSGYLFLPY